MHKAKAMKWVKALRSGKYEQGTGGLKNKKINPENGVESYDYCCLGVLAEINGLKNLEKYGLLDIEMLNKVGLHTRYGSVKSAKWDDHGLIQFGTGKNKKYFKTLAISNDANISFKQIATWIEKNYKKL